METHEIKERITKGKGQKEQLEKFIKEKSGVITLHKTKLPYIEKAQVLIQQTAKETQEQLKFNLEDIVQTAIDSCFPDEYKFEIEFVTKRSATECNFWLIDDYGEKKAPMDSNGGGIVDIIAFALRIASWAISKKDNLIILDEPFKFLSANLRPLAAEIMRTLSAKLGLQILLVSHDETLIEIADVVFPIRKNREGISKLIQANI